MLDWPGKICTVVFLGGCNFRCPYCHNPELVEAGESTRGLPWTEVEGFLKKRAGWIDGVSITGGEPTLHADLSAFCRDLKDLGMLVKLDTNGSRPEALEELLEKNILDYVAMDVKSSFEKYSQVAGKAVDPSRIERSIRLIVASGVEHEFRCTVVPGLVDLVDLLSLAQRLAGASELVLQQFRPEVTLDPGFTGVEPYPEELLLDWAEELSALVKTRVRGLVELSRSS
jgi:pyruvate formate lyase activating enzyme